jgi:hypothetical protein
MGSEGQPASYAVCAVGSFSEDTTACHEADHSAISVSEVELHFCSPHMLAGGQFYIL